MAWISVAWKVFCAWLVRALLPLACFGHYMLCENVFLNTADCDAKGLEKAGDVLFIPVQYILRGQEIQRDAGNWEQFVMGPKFTYTDYVYIKMSVATALSPFSLCLGSLVKGVAYLSSDVREKHDAVVRWINSGIVVSNFDKYRALGMDVDEIGTFTPTKVQSRRPGDELRLAEAKEALASITAVLRENKIPYWVDCGTCLGVYRHEGSIPWDDDVDIAILQDDFDNALRVLRNLDREKYWIQDWSGLDKPKSYLQVFDWRTKGVGDIYVFKIDPETRTACLISSQENSIFFSEEWKIRERQYVIPTPLSMIFPLRKGMFDGIEVYVPNQTRAYLQMRYGENLDPVKVYNPVTGEYEKDLSHPYWQLPHRK